MDEPQFDAAFDYDGTLTEGDGPVGVDHGKKLDFRPLQLVMRAGYTCAIMTCNDPAFVANKLSEHGIVPYLDGGFRFKVPDPVFAGMVLVTNRKVLARFYFDDRAVPFRFGDDPGIPLRTLDGLRWKALDRYEADTLLGSAAGG